MVVIQPSTLKVVVLYESKEKHWFLPKGRYVGLVVYCAHFDSPLRFRKDIGESLEQAALREAHEEAQYCISSRVVSR